MKTRAYLLLALFAVAVALAVSNFEPFPGYLDADYYFGGGIRLAEGKGFTEPYLWNYLDDPVTLPHPSHTYWMPLASIVAAGGMWVTGQVTYGAARLGFLVFAALIPIVTAAVAYSFSRRTDLAVTSGLLAVFSGYYAPFVAVTDNYAIYIVAGGLFFLILGSMRKTAVFALGALAGLLTLARSDGMLWMGVTAGVILWNNLLGPLAGPNGKRWRRLVAPGSERIGSAILQLALAAGGFFLVTGAWFWHTYGLFGTFMAPGGSRLLWLKNYDETFLYPASQLTFSRWLAQGWAAMFAARLAALKWNLLNAFAAQGELVLAPFILLGIWIHRRNGRVVVACLIWFALLVVMTVVFPFAGARGGFFHAGAALQSLWWAMAPLGLESAIAAARARNMFTSNAFIVFRAALVGLAMLTTLALLAIRVLPGWGEGEQNYPGQLAFLRQAGLQSSDVVMVRNPPGFFVMTRQPGIVVPYGDAAAMLSAATRYQAKYLIIESAGAAGPIKSVYDDTSSTTFQFLGEIDGARFFRIPR